MIGPLLVVPGQPAQTGMAVSAEAGDGFAALFAALVPQLLGEVMMAGDSAGVNAVRPQEDDAEAAAAPEPLQPSPEALLALVTQTPAPPPDAVAKAGEPVEPAKSPPAQPGRDTGLRDRAGPPLPGLTTSLAPLPVALPLAEQVAREVAGWPPGQRQPEPVMRARLSGGQPTEMSLPADAALAPPSPQSWKDAVPVMPRILPDVAPPPVREPADARREAGAAPLAMAPLLPPPPPLEAAAMPPSPQPAAPMLASQLAAALPRLRREGGEAVLTLEPARLGRVTLAWQADSEGPAVLTLRAVEPATAVLLTRLGDDLAALLRTDPAAGGQPVQEFRLDIGRAERPAEQRQPEPRSGELAGQATTLHSGADAGQSRQSPRRGAEGGEGTQIPARAAVRDDDTQDSDAGHASGMVRAARLA